MQEEAGRPPPQVHRWEAAEMKVGYIQVHYCTTDGREAAEHESGAQILDLTDNTTDGKLQNMKVGHIHLI
jgi:hypothetical protein